MFYLLRIILNFRVMNLQMQS